MAELSVAIVLLAAGTSSRTGPDGPHKLLAEFDGEPLVRRCAKAACGSQGSPVLVVTGYRSGDMLAVLDGLDVTPVQNADFGTGIASSLAAGLSEAGDKCDGVLVMLADMPWITSDVLNSLIRAFQDHEGRAIVRACARGKPGNPVILPRTLFRQAAGLRGDSGARHLIETCGLPIADVELGEAARYDVDTVEAIRAAGGILKG